MYCVGDIHCVVHTCVCNSGRSEVAVNLRNTTRMEQQGALESMKTRTQALFSYKLIHIFMQCLACATNQSTQYT